VGPVRLRSDRAGGWWAAEKLPFKLACLQIFDGPLEAQQRRWSWSLIDLGALTAVLLAVGGVNWKPQLSGACAQAQPVPCQPSLVTWSGVRGVPVCESAADRGRPAGPRSHRDSQPNPRQRVKLEADLFLQRAGLWLFSRRQVRDCVDPNQAMVGFLMPVFLLEGRVGRTGGGVVVLATRT